jgi:hypothetical protein
MTSAELVCLSALRGARAWFFGEIEAHAAAHAGLGSAADLDREHRKLLRSEPVAQIAEFFYVLRDGNITVPDGLRGFLIRHRALLRHLTNLLRCLLAGSNRTCVSPVTLGS